MRKHHETSQHDQINIRPKFGIQNHSLQYFHEHNAIDHNQRPSIK